MKSEPVSPIAAMRLALVTALLAGLFVGVVDAGIGLGIAGPDVGGITLDYALAIIAPTLVTAAILGLATAALCLIGNLFRIPLGRQRSVPIGVALAAVGLLGFLEWANLTLFEGADISRRSWRPAAEWGLRLAVLPVGVLIAVWLLRPKLARAATARPTVLDRLFGATLLGGAVALLYANATILHGLYDYIHLQEVVLAFVAAQVGLVLLLAGGFADPSATGRRATIAVSLVAMVFAGAIVMRGSDQARRARGAALARARGLPFHGELGDRIINELRPLKKLDAVDVSDVLALVRAKDPAAISAALDAAIPNRRRLNMLWISFDTLRGDRCGFNGYDGGTTPNLDALAKDAFVFRRAQAAYPTSNYSYSSVLTSLYPRITPAYKYYKKLDRGYSPETPLPGLLSPRGWHTVGITAFDKETSNKPSWFGSFREGFDSFNPDQKVGASWAPDINASVLKALRGRPKDKPYFVWGHYIEPHAPYVEHEGFPVGSSERELYDGEIRYTDAKLGELMDTLQREGHLDDTVIVFFSDHGEAFGEHDAKYHNSTVYQTQIHVPLFIKVPGLKGRVIDDAVSLTDLLPTFTDLVGIEDPVRRMGRSLVPMMIDPDGDHLGFSYSEVFLWLSGRHARDQRALVVGNHKIILRPYQDAWEIYDLDADPGETRSLVGSDPDLERKLLSLINRVDEEIDGYFGEVILSADEKRAAYLAKIDRLVQNVVDLEGSEEAEAFTELEVAMFSAYAQLLPDAERYLGPDGVSAVLERIVKLYPNLHGATGNRLIKVLGFWPDPKSVPFLEEVWKASKGYRRHLTAWALAMHGVTEVRDELRAAMGQQPAIGLARIGDAQSLPWVKHSLWDPNRPIVCHTLAALRHLPEGLAIVARTIRARVTTGIYMGFEVKLAMLDTLEHATDPDATVLLVRFLADPESLVRDRARALLEKRMSADDIRANEAAARMELAGDLAQKNLVHVLAVSRYQEALKTGTLFNSHLRLRLARVQKLAGRLDAARATLEEVAARSDVPADRVVARRRIAQLSSPFRIQPKTFSASVDEAGIRLHTKLQPFNAFRVTIPIKNTSPHAWHGGAFRFGVQFEVRFVDANGKLIEPRRPFVNWLPEEGVAPGEEITLSLVGIVPPKVENGRIVLRIVQEWGKFENDGIFYTFPQAVFL